MLRRLSCASQSYDWGKMGSSSMVCQLKAASSPSFTCEPSKPYAELWMGTHPSGPSKFVDHGCENLADYIHKDTSVLGTESVKLFGETLPFLFKVLSVNKALSIQAHPNKVLAEKLHAEHPDVYKDDNHKPELAIALSDFEALLCFRTLEEILVFCRGIPELQGLLKTDLCQTDREDEKALIKRLYSHLMSSPADEVHEAVTTLATRLEREGTIVLPQPAPVGLHLQDLSALFLRLNQQFPGDVGCFSIFFFNYVKLRPGEAIFLGASLPHAYISGDCIECMANSDNVVRAGLTPKFKDVTTLLEMLDYSPLAASALRFAPTRTSRLAEGGAAASLTSFKPPVKDFAVDKIVISSTDLGRVTLPAVVAASIILFIEGNGTISPPEQAHSAPTTDSGSVQFGRGSVFFVPADVVVEIRPATGNGDILAFRAYANVE
uniref:mannose-6-phosphate isomerase n=2 Tax=Schistocephalus solidus TaxID=70667 RepID=A0A0X3PLY5_SCHSO